MHVTAIKAGAAATEQLNHQLPTEVHMHAPLLLLVSAETLVARKGAV